VTFQVGRPRQHCAAYVALGQSFVDMLVHRQRLPGGKAFVTVFAFELFRFVLLLIEFWKKVAKRKLAHFFGIALYFYSLNAIFGREKLRRKAPSLLGQIINGSNVHFRVYGQFRFMNFIHMYSHVV
jgi:hypothetical protein